jgi:hypothetical protein
LPTVNKGFKNAFEILSRDPAIADGLIGDIEKALAPAEDPDAIDSMGQRAFVGITRLIVDNTQTRRIKKAIEPHYFHRFKNNLVNTAVNSYRNGDIRELTQKLSEGTLNAEDALDVARKALALTYCTDIASADSFCSCLQALDRVMPAPGDRERGTLVDSLARSVMRSLRRHRELASMPLLETADLHLLYHLGEDNPKLRRDIRTLLEGEVKTRVTTGHDIERYLLDTFKKDQIEDNLITLESVVMPRSGRTGLLEENEHMAGTIMHYATHMYPALALKSLRQGLSLSDPEKGLGDMPALISSDERLYRLYCTLAPGADADEEIAPAWHHFRDILKMTGGESHFDLAVDTYCYVEQQVAAGKDRGKVLTHAVECYAMGTDPRSTPVREDWMASTEIEMLDDNQISIAGIKLGINEHGFER